MKPLRCIIAAAVLPCLGSTFAQTRPIGPPVDNRLANAMRAQDAENRFRASVANQWRLVNGQRSSLADRSWIFLSGRVVQSTSDGAHVMVEGERVLIANAPLLADNETFSGLVKESGLHRYNTVGQSVATIRKFDFGVPTEPPKPTAAEIAMARDRASLAAYERAEERQRMAPKVLQFQLQQATNGLPSFQYIVGQRYLTGDGLPTNTALAREWFSKAAAQGDSQAKKALEQLVVSK